MIETAVQTVIRKAEPRDQHSIMLLVMESYEENVKQFGFSFAWSTADKVINNLIQNHVFLVAEKDGVIIGCIGGVIESSIFDESQRIGQETIWYVSKNERKGLCGIRLLKRFEKECKDKGANFIVMGHLSNSMADKLDNIYKKMNYKDTETHYIKEV